MMKRMKEDRLLCEKVCLHVFRDCDCVWLKAVPAAKRMKKENGQKHLCFKFGFFWQNEAAHEIRDGKMLEDCFCLKFSEDVKKLLERRIQMHGFRGLRMSKTRERWRPVREEFGEKLLEEIERRGGKLELVTESGQAMLNVKSVEELLMKVELDDVHDESMQDDA